MTISEVCVTAFDQWQYERRRQIERTAFGLLAEKGYRSTSMLQIAHRSSASNQTLQALGPLLLEFTTGEKAIIMNRAAIADAGDTGILSEAIDRAARREMASLITLTLSRLESSGRFHRDTNLDEAAETYISLLFGEVPMRPVRERGAGRLSNQIENSGPS